MIVNCTKKIDDSVDIRITGITLLSIEEYGAAEDVVPDAEGCWWLRSPGYCGLFAAYVNGDGDVGDDGYNVYHYELGVRPALVIDNLKSVNLKKGDTFKLAAHDWTVISKNMALCDDIIAKRCFRKNWQAKDANDYETADIKKWLEQWATDHGILGVSNQTDMPADEKDLIAEKCEEMQTKIQNLLGTTADLTPAPDLSLNDTKEVLAAMSEKIKAFEENLASQYKQMQDEVPFVLSMLKNVRNKIDEFMNEKPEKC